MESIEIKWEDRRWVSWYKGYLLVVTYGNAYKQEPWQWYIFNESHINGTAKTSDEAKQAIKQAVDALEALKCEG